MDCFECVASGRFYGENGRCADDWQDFPIVTQDQAGFLVCSNNHNKGERCCESLTGESYDVHRCVELNEVVGHTYGDDPYSSLTCDHQCIKCPIWVCQTNCMADDCIEQCRRPQPPPDCHTTFDGTDPKTCQCVAELCKHSCVPLSLTCLLPLPQPSRRRFPRHGLCLRDRGWHAKLQAKPGGGHVPGLLRLPGCVLKP